MAPNESPTACPLTNDPESTFSPPYERKGTFDFLRLAREIRDMIYAEVADPTYALDTALADTVSYMRTKSSIETCQKHTSSSGEPDSSNGNSTNTDTDNKPTNPKNPPNITNLDDLAHPALTLNNLRLHPLAQTNHQIRREYLAAHFENPTFTLSIAICALQAPHPKPICGSDCHINPRTRQYDTAKQLRAARSLDTSRLNDRPVLRHQHFKVTVLTDYNDATTRPLHSLRLLGKRNAHTTRVEWEGFVDVVFHKGKLSVEGELVGPMTGRAREATAETAERAFEELKKDLKRTCAGGRSRVANPTAPCGGWEDKPLRCPPNSPVLAAVSGK